MKVPEPRRLKSGTWFIQMRLGGVSVPVSAPTAKECRDTAQLIKAEHRAGKRATKRKSDKTLKMIVEDYIAAREPVRSPATIRGYTQIKDQRFASYMDKLPGDIDFQRMINDETGVVGQKTVKNSWMLIRASLDAAGLPVPKVELPTVPVKDIPFLQPEEIPSFLSAVRGDIAEIGILLELQGLRRSEATGLMWEDVDLDKGILHVRHARVKDKTGAFVQKDTLKNASSVRFVPIMIGQLREALNAVQDRTGYVVTIAANTLYAHVRKACERAGVTVVGNHGLRHSFASLGYHLGLSERQIMDLGGWSDYMTMHKIYIRLAAADKAAAQNALSDFFDNANKNANALQKS